VQTVSKIKVKKITRDIYKASYAINSTSYITPTCITIHTYMQTFITQTTVEHTRPEFDTETTITACL